MTPQHLLFMETGWLFDVFQIGLTATPDNRIFEYFNQHPVSDCNYEKAVTCLKDKSITDIDNLPVINVLALDIVENLEAGLESFRTIIASLNLKNYRKNTS